MRLNVYLAAHAGLSRRSADEMISAGRVTVNGQLAELGEQVGEQDRVSIDGQVVEAKTAKQTIMLNKPVGYVCSRDGQGSETVYDLLPPELHSLKPVGRLDKDTSGLLLMSTDGELAFQLTHPKFEKTKRYTLSLDRPLSDRHKAEINRGVELEDGVSKLQIDSDPDTPNTWFITMYEGRNRQIRRTFEALGYKVTALHRYEFGSYKLGKLPAGKYQTVVNWTKNRYNVVNE